MTRRQWLGIVPVGIALGTTGSLLFADEDKPTGSIKIRIETIAYFLSRHREKLVRNKTKMAEIEARLAEMERELRAKTVSGGVRTTTVVGV